MSAAHGLPNCRAILDEALASPNGVRFELPTREAQDQTYRTLHRLRSDMKRANAKQAGLPLTADGTSPYDNLYWSKSKEAPWTITITHRAGDLLKEIDIKLEYL
jgi:hypothetical protein